MEHFLSNAEQMFRYYKTLGDKSFDQLSDEALYWKAHDNDNSIAIIIKHMWGNMMSRWTHFLDEDGEKDWRRRDAEFELEDLQGREALLLLWEEAWKCLFDALHSIGPKNYDQVVYIRSKGHTIVEAIQRQLAHYAYHIGQIVYMAKSIQKDQWKSLSMPKGTSEAFTKASHSKGLRKEHFVKEQLDDRLR